MKKSTLNPNAKEFNPTKPLLSVVRWDGKMRTGFLRGLRVGVIEHGGGAVKVGLLWGKQVSRLGMKGHDISEECLYVSP